MNGVIAVDDPRAEDVRALLAAHLAFAHQHSPREDVHALDVDGLLDPAVTFFSYRVDGRLVAVGALRHLDETHGELKSMHTAQAARGRGVGRAMLAHLIAEARARGYRRLSLETGTMARLPASASRSPPSRPATPISRRRSWRPRSPAWTTTTSAFSPCE